MGKRHRLYRMMKIRLLHLWFILCVIVFLSLVSYMPITIYMWMRTRRDSAIMKMWTTPDATVKVQNSFRTSGVHDVDIYGGNDIMPQEIGSTEATQRSATPTPLVSSSVRPKRLEEKAPSMKLIMDYNPRVPRMFKFTSCEYNACALTSDPAKADLVMFNGALMGKVTTLPKRPQNQIWLMHTREPPEDKRFIHLRRPDFVNQINWTVTVFNDSTFPAVYGTIVEKPEVPKRDYEAIYRNKKYDVAWFVSHCSTQSQREKYVKRMFSNITVHIFGSCGDRRCGAKGYKMGGRKEECLARISKEYKFYLSFENSFCRDYITEKFFFMYDDVDVIPVVRGGGDYRRLFPSGIFINAGDFRSPEDLAVHLSKLSRDKERYLAMLRKKNRYTCGGNPISFACQLCKALHLRQPVNVYKDIYQWFKRPGNCWDPDDL